MKKEQTYSKIEDFKCRLADSLNESYYSYEFDCVPVESY